MYRNQFSLMLAGTLCHFLGVGDLARLSVKVLKISQTHPPKTSWTVVLRLLALPLMLHDS